MGNAELARCDQNIRKLSPAPCPHDLTCAADRNRAMPLLDSAKAIAFGVRLGGSSAPKSILHANERGQNRANDKHIRWRQVLTADNDKEAEEFNKEIERELLDKWSSTYKLLHLLMLMYEELAVPVRLAYPLWVILNPGFILIDVITDVRACAARRPPRCARARAAHARTRGGG